MRRASVAALFATLAALAISPFFVRADPIQGRGGGIASSRVVATTAPLTGGGDLSADRTIAISAATSGAAGSMSAADKAKLDALGTSSAATHSITVASTGTGLALYNTADQTTNYERVLLSWASNVATISAEKGGTANTRGMNITNGAMVELLSTQTFKLSGIATTDTLPLLDVVNSTSWSSTSAVQSGISVTGTVNQASGSGGFNGILVAPTFTACGSAGCKLLRLAPGGSDKFVVDNNGKVTQDCTVTAGGTTGNQTINKPCGTVNFAAAASSISLTNSTISANSLVRCFPRTNDSTAKSCVAVPGSGSATLVLNAGATAETSVGFEVVN
jgi:hypothetical protein